MARANAADGQAAREAHVFDRPGENAPHPGAGSPLRLFSFI